MSLDDFEDDGTLVARGRWSIIAKFGKILAKWGKKAWDYIYCVGFNSMLDCGDEVCALPLITLRLLLGD